MEVTDPYYQISISSIPKDQLKQIIKNELLGLMFDFGQKIAPGDPEFTHIEYRIFMTLTQSYSHWRMGLLDQCIREGKVNTFDKATRITVQRLELWFSSYEKKTNYRLNQSKGDDIVIYPYPPEYYRKNAERFLPIIRFRQSRKPEYDHDNWTLEEIEKTDGYQSWKQKRGSRSQSMSIADTLKF